MAEAETTGNEPAGKGLRVALWGAQVLLALVFVMAGLVKLTMPIEKLTAQMPWMSGAFGPWVRLIAASDLAGGIGVLLPSVTRIQPRLTVLAAGGLVVIMLLATITHAMYGEWNHIGGTLMFGGLAAFVAWGRHAKAPIAARVPRATG